LFDPTSPSDVLELVAGIIVAGHARRLARVEEGGVSWVEHWGVPWMEEGRGPWVDEGGVPQVVDGAVP